jgi:hypothetical protein
MLKFIKYLLLGLLALILLLVILGFLAHEPRPDSNPTLEADQLAEKMLTALNKEAYDSLDIISWTFPRGHRYRWNKQADQVRVQWGQYEANFNTETREGTAAYQGQMLTDKEKENAIQQAWELFANDSFWLVAPYKVKDPGTERTIVQTESGTGLLVTYTSGGVTPGDAYLWILDEEYRPKAWKMWVSILPLGGVETTWEDWQQLEGAWFAPNHAFPFGARLDLKDLSVE